MAWPSRVGSPRTTGRRPRRLHDESVTPLRSAKARSRSTWSRATSARSTSASMSGWPPSIAARSSSSDDHLGELRRLHLRCARAARAPGAGARPASRTSISSEEVHVRDGRAELVGEVVEELRADPLEPAELGDVLEHDPRDAVRPAARARTASHRPSEMRGGRSPAADPTRARPATRSSTRWSRNASIALPPTSDPGRRSEDPVGRRRSRRIDRVPGVDREDTLDQVVGDDAAPVDRVRRSRRPR